MMKTFYSACLLLFAAIFCIDASAQTSWHYLKNRGLDTGITRFEDVYFLDSNRGFAVNLHGKIFKTTDGGENWSVSLKLRDTVSFRSIEFLDDGLTGLAGTLCGLLYKTTDGGDTWTDIDSLLPDTVPGYGCKYVCGFSHLSRSFFGVGSWGATQGRFYESINSGRSWKVHYIDTALANYLVDVVFISDDTGFIAGGKGQNYLHPGRSLESVVLKTVDGGQHWKKVFSDTSIGGRIWKLQFINHQLGFGSIEPFHSDTAAMIKSADGGDSWKIVGSGFKTRLASNSFVSTQGVGFRTPMHGWLGGYYSGIFETKDGGLTWDSVSFGANFNRIYVLDSNHVFAGGKQVYRYGYDISPLAVPAPDNTVRLPHNLYPVVPNPAKGSIKIEFDLKTTTNILLQVSSIDSRRAWQIATGRMKPGHYVYYWNDAGAPSGNYMVWLGTDEIPITQKFVLLR